MGRFNDLTGQHFGRLTVIERAGSYRARGKYEKPCEPMWRCLCDPTLGGCGNETFVISHNLKTGRTRSCGCLRNELATERLGRYRPCKK